MTSKKLKIIGISVFVICLIVFATYNYVMHGGARDLTTETTDYTMLSKNSTDEFVKDVDAANKKYREKAIAIRGTITSKTTTEITLDNTIICTLKNTDS